MTDEPSDFFALASDLARLEAATARADRLRQVARFRREFALPSEPQERVTRLHSTESARVRDCIEAGVKPYGEL